VSAPQPLTAAREDTATLRCPRCGAKGQWVSASVTRGLSAFWQCVSCGAAGPRRSDWKAQW
jgi:predicted RNA-binding Zn-ribbon protein involved in translation (DUF1610 family)